MFGLFQIVGGLAGCVRGRGLGAGAPRLLGFILLGGFGGAFLAVSGYAWSVVGICGAMGHF